MIVLLALLALSAHAADAPPPVILEVAQSSAPAVAQETPADKPAIRLIEAYQDGGSTKFILESRTPLVTGRSVYAGVREEALTIGDQMSRKEGLYYYAASAPGKLNIRPGDPIRLDRTTTSSLPKAVIDSLRPGAGFEQKNVAEVTAVQGDRILIDKGTLHEVHERDLYRILDASGNFKGNVEVRGIGDQQSSAILSNALGARTGAGLSAQPGDYAVFMGQRRMFSFGLLYGQRLEKSQILFAADKSFGGGVLWNISFYNGWGLETLLGYYTREGEDETVIDVKNAPERVFVYDKRHARYLLPVSLKKNFFRHFLVSPFAAAGGYIFMGEHTHSTAGPSHSINRDLPVEQTTGMRGIYPQFGFGLDFFPTRLVRPRIEVRHFHGPNIAARGNVFRTASTIYSAGVMATW